MLAAADARDKWQNRGRRMRCAGKQRYHGERQSGRHARTRIRREVCSARLSAREVVSPRGSGRVSEVDGSSRRQ